MPVNDALLHNWFYGNRDVRIVAAVLFAYLICSIPLEAIVAWLFDGLDPRLANVARAVVPFMNALKGYIATVIPYHGGGESIGLACAFAATIGHCSSPWRRFRSGGTIDANVGMLFAIDWRCAVLVILFFAVTQITARDTRTATLFAAALMFFPLWYFVGPFAALYGIAAGTALALRVGMRGQLPKRVQIQNLDRTTAASRNESPLLQLK